MYILAFSIPPPHSILSITKNMADAPRAPDSGTAPLPVRTVPAPTCCRIKTNSAENTACVIPKGPFGDSKLSDAVFCTKNNEFYNRFWRTGCRIRTKNEIIQHKPPRRPDYAISCGEMLYNMEWIAKNTACSCACSVPTRRYRAAVHPTGTGTCRPVASYPPVKQVFICLVPLRT